jgi:hypothetical protein
MFQSVSVKHNFNVKLINNMPFDVLLNERVLKESPKQILTGNYFFRDVKFKGIRVTHQKMFGVFEFLLRQAMFGRFGSTT